MKISLKFGRDCYNLNVLCEIQKNYTLFSEKERDIADYILQSNDQIKNINITDLSKAIGLSLIHI